MITTNEIHSTFKGQSSDDVGAEDYGPCMHGVICCVMRFIQAAPISLPSLIKNMTWQPSSNQNTAFYPPDLWGFRSYTVQSQSPAHPSWMTKLPLPQ